MSSGSFGSLARCRPFSHLMVKRLFINDAHQSERPEVQNPSAWRSGVPEDKARPDLPSVSGGRGLDSLDGNGSWAGPQTWEVERRRCCARCSGGLFA